MKNFISKLSVETIIEFCKQNGMDKEEITEFFQEFTKEIKAHPCVVNKEFLERIANKVKGGHENGTR